MTTEEKILAIAEIIERAKVQILLVISTPITPKHKEGGVMIVGEKQDAEFIIRKQ